PAKTRRGVPLRSLFHSPDSASKSLYTRFNRFSRNLTVLLRKSKKTETSGRQKGSPLKILLRPPKLPAESFGVSRHKLFHHIKLFFQKQTDPLPDQQKMITRRRMMDQLIAPPSIEVSAVRRFFRNLWVTLTLLSKSTPQGKDRAALMHQSILLAKLR